MIQKHSQGFTLTEIMVALVISSILMAGVLTIMSSSKRTYALQSELSDLQENARFVMEELARDIRIAGYKGCRSDLLPIDAQTLLPINLGPPFNATLNGTSVNNRDITEEKGAPISGDPFPKSDALVMSAFFEPLQAADATPQFNSDDTEITLHPRSIVPDGSDFRDEVVVSDCGGTAVYKVVSSNGTNPITITFPLLRDYLQPVSIFIVGRRAIAYEVRRTTEGEFALFQFRCVYNKDTGNCAGDGTQEARLVEGVENLQVRYGIDTAPRDGIPNQYSATPPAFGVTDKVVSVRISLLMRTNNKRGDLDGATDKDFHLSPDLTYDSAAGPYNPQQDNSTLESGYRHRMFTSTIKVRN